MNWEQKLLSLRDNANMLLYKEDNDLDMINKKISLYSEKIFGDSEKYGMEAKNIPYRLFVDSCPESEQREIWLQGQQRLVNLIETMIEDYQISFNDGEKKGKMKNNKKVFIVHGHNDKLKLEVANWLYGLDLKPIILHEQANSGVKSIINKLETYSDVRCAIILMTSDDKGKAKEEKLYKDRARQNVIFEAGYFIGKLEAQNVILLYEEGIEMSGDLGGCVYVEVNDKNDWKEEVRREFNKMGIEYSK